MSVFPAGHMQALWHDHRLWELGLWQGGSRDTLLALHTVTLHGAVAGCMVCRERALIHLT